MNSMPENVPPVQSVERQRLLRCPDWCVTEHTHDLRNPVDNLVLHEAPPLATGIRICRTDCPDEGRVGEPVLYVAVELELGTYQEAAEFAAAVLNGIFQLLGGGPDYPADDGGFAERFLDERNQARRAPGYAAGYVSGYANGRARSDQAD